MDQRSSAERAFGAHSEPRIGVLARMVTRRYAGGMAAVAGLVLIAAGSAKVGATLLSVVGMVAFAVNARRAYRTNPEPFHEQVHPAKFYAAAVVAVVLLVATIVTLASR